MTYSKLFTELNDKADSCSDNLDITGLSEVLMKFASLGSSISEPMLQAKIDGDKDTYRAYQRLDKDIGRKMNAIRSRLSALKVEKERIHEAQI